MNATMAGMVEPQILPKNRLSDLVNALQDADYQVVAPVEEGGGPQARS